MKRASKKEKSRAQSNTQRYGPFFGRRVAVAFLSGTLLTALIILLWLAASKNITTGTIIVPVVIGTIGILFTILQWLFPLNTSTSTAPSDSSVTLSKTAIVQSQAHSFADIFHFNETQLPDPGEFYGREYERLTLLTRTGKRNSTAIVGDYRTGKSWLMQYLQQRVSSQSETKVRVGKFSATHPQSHTPAGFVKRALEVLDMAGHKTGAHVTPLERLALAARELKGFGIIPVLCIDEFAGILDKEGFGKEFIMGLRAIAEDEGLVLVTASKQSLHQIIENMTGETSPLFNIMPEISLKPFTEAEARVFVSEKSQQAAFSKNEQALFLEYAAIARDNEKPCWPPLRLQLVGQMLLAEKRRAAEERRTYTCNDPVFQEEFKIRLEEQYKAVVKKA